MIHFARQWHVPCFDQGSVRQESRCFPSALPGGGVTATTDHSMGIRRYCDYDRLARVYDSYLSHFGERVLPALERLVLHRLPPRAWILDVCCGTGQLARALCERGYQVTGLDGSAEMLRFARKNAPAAELVVADARDFRLSRQFDAAVSTHDSLNHMSSIADLTAVLTHVRSVLRSGACFAFDLNMEPAFATRWNGCLRATEDDEVCEIRACWDDRHVDDCRRLGQVRPAVRDGETTRRRLPDCPATRRVTGTRALADRPDGRGSRICSRRAPACSCRRSASAQ